MFPKSIKKLSQGGAQLDLLLTSKEQPIVDIVQGRKLKSWKKRAKLVGLEQCTTEEQILFGDLLGRIEWKTGLNSKGALESWLIFKNNLLKAQEWLILTCRKLNKCGMVPD